MEKLGAPLLAALPPGMDGEKAAETVAALVAKSVQAGLLLGNAMKLSDEDGDIDSIRLSLAAIAAPLLGQFYKDSGRLPDDAAVEKLVKGLEAALVFSENFTPAMEHTARLKSLHNPLPVIDATQTALLSLNALTPAVQAVQHFSFGQSDAALVKDVSDRLQQTAQQLSAASVKGDEGDRAFGSLMLLRAISELFASAHGSVLRAHTGDAAPSLQSVWALFDAQVAMMSALSGAAVPAAQSSSGPAPAAQSGGNPMGFFKKGDEAPPPPPQPATDTPPASPPAATSGSPMAFFKPGAKKADEGNE